MLFLIIIFTSSFFPVNIEYRYSERSDSFFFIYVLCEKSNFEENMQNIWVQIGYWAIHLFS